MSTICQAKFATISLVKTDDCVRECIQDINNPEFWKAMYQLLQAVFLALRALRYADSGKPSMIDKMYTLCHQIQLALNASKEPLSNQVLFPVKVDVGLEQEMVMAEAEDEEEELELEERFVVTLSCKSYYFF